MKVEELIELYKDEFGYVSDIRDLTKFLKEHEDIDIKERNMLLFRIIEWNLKKEKENRALLEGIKPVIETHDVETIEEPAKAQIDKKETTIMEVGHYIDAIKACDDDDFLTEILPSIYDNNFDSIIGAILLYFFNEITLGNQMLKEEESEESIEYLRAIIKRDKEIIRIIKEYSKDEEECVTIEETEESKPVNKLIFLKKSNNSLYIDDDIDDIAIEDDILPILNDIINGSITREKRFHNSNELKGISAIRRRDSRIIFVRLDNDVILILGVLVKRFQNTQVYRDMLDSRVKTFKQQRDKLKESLEDEEFLEEHESIKNRILETIKSRKRIAREKKNG